MIVRLHPQVDNDLLDAMEYYEREAVADLALEFYQEFRRCAEVVGQRPTSFPEIDDGIRRMNFHRFSFHILFEIIDPETVEIFAVKHDGRDPDFGLDR
ncbi:MAG: type II toxin-antitoxin system RelE/ParE family toxin [Acidobacteria bacterium]|nr:type II toxin-antitoxin system RelE/ParE family toxin [Acidobacteriota bacterium]MCW5949157.1 type II toxin-antitoxin system RelE/ParE family toxin [Pyrinomonadaceae bacterium]